MDGTFIASIAPLDDSNRYLQNWEEILQALQAFLSAHDTELSETGNCLFLGADNRCLIHPIRPGACRLFPYLQQGIVSYANDLDSLIDPRADVPCSPECFEIKKYLLKNAQQLLREIAEAEAGAHAQEVVTIQEAETILGTLWEQRFRTPL